MSQETPSKTKVEEPDNIVFPKSLEYALVFLLIVWFAVLPGTSMLLQIIERSHVRSLEVRRLEAELNSKYPIGNKE